MAEITPAPYEPPALPRGSLFIFHGREYEVAYDFHVKDTCLHACTKGGESHFTINYVRWIAPRWVADTPMVKVVRKP